jgi:hypothetical protein
MPRERGKPRRGPAWYSLAARQRRQQRLERALSMARTQRIQTARREGMAWSPPMAYVEEVILEEPIQIPPESLLFTVPENWQPPSSFPEEDTKSATTAHHDTNTMEAKMEEFHICYVEEEFPEELLHMASQDATLSAGYDPSRATAREEDPGKKVGAQGWSATTEHQEGAEDGMQAATSEVVEGPGGTTKEGGKVLAPPPISIAPEQWRAPPPFFHPEQLDLVFDLRSQMADQVYRGTLMHQRIDMLYEAFSNAPTGQRCLTCARPYALPTRNGPHNEDPDKATSGTNG